MCYCSNANGTEFTVEQYRQWMCCKENRFACEECPENRGISSQGSVGPCGQQNCWVDCHCGD